MLRRVFALLTIRLRAHLGGELVPFAALLAQGSLVGALALMVRSTLGPFGFSLFVLAVSAGLLALTLLGEFGGLLRSDPAAAWVESLPASKLERRLGHSLAVLVLLSLLSCSVLMPAALLAPEGMAWSARGLLLVAGLAQGVAIGSALLLVQVLFGERAEGLLVLLQTALVIGAVTGLLNAPGLAPELQAIEMGDAAWPEILSFAPPAWYASISGTAPAGSQLPALWLLALGTLGAIALLGLLPPASDNSSGRRRSLLGRALRPLRDLATRSWVRPAERGTFDLVYDALPLERDFVLRTYPMVGIPLAFLVVGADADGGEGMRDLLALLLFTPAIYLPVLLAHVPVTSSPGASWMLATAPVLPEDIQNGAIKALAIRFLLPLYAVLSGLALFFAGGSFALRLAIPGAILTLTSLRLLYPRCTLALPLSSSADAVEVHHDWTGFLLTLAVGLTILATFVQRRVVELPHTLLLIAALVVVDRMVTRRPK
ncbi:MAG: hypothetical protein ACI9F9_000054 [Candidatus Paceibacteria bacterium]|jgi:hypothetical protein